MTFPVSEPVSEPVYEPSQTLVDDRLTGAVKRLTAIAHEGRLRLMRLLVQAGPEGELAGELARKTGVGATTASAQLQVLSNAELVSAERQGRQVIYRVNYPSLEGLLGYLLEDCCGGRSEICGPLSVRLRKQLDASGTQQAAACDCS